MDKRTFPGLSKRLKDAVAFSRVNAINTLETCGIHPLNREEITSDKLSTSIPLINQTESSLNADEHTRENIEAEVPPPSVSTNTTLTPRRKSIETALLSYLKQITPPDKNEIRVRARRTLAECLTSDEVRMLMREDEAHKHEKCLKKVKKTPRL